MDEKHPDDVTKLDFQFCNCINYNSYKAGIGYHIRGDCADIRSYQSRDTVIILLNKIVIVDFIDIFNFSMHFCTFICILSYDRFREKYLRWFYTKPRFVNKRETICV